ncbi:MAG TPA: UDP-N-acetylglucosamine--N-acetylmuramyl-(pentapeptide) pyrophosphoryl-undecaprenol N-acetylglucosamine transferase [Candidatus Saccharimonadales bacterium]|nr:UDP-N-acetylglucosamine--N-acetylmuramyl-(pentapeptide) pyrophosphoryl-undecaprenol N-acetylglucosamine transferase [Candidatus Saccharimonadales bacterium]
MSLARELKSQAPGCQIVYVGHKGDNIDTLKKKAEGFDFMVFIKAGKFRRYHGNNFLFHFIKLKTLLLNIRDFFRLPGSIIASYRILNRFKPDAVFSKGGFVAVPVSFAARLKGIPIITHDSDTVPGLANRIIGRWAKVHTTGMPEEFYSYPRGTVRYVGIPIDEHIKKVTPKLQREAKRHLKIPESSPVLLVSGGGNGSKHLNDLMIAIAPSLLEANLALHIIHLTGATHEQEVKEVYKDRLPRGERKRVRIAGFSPDFYELASAADLVVGRAGATTLAELSVAGKPCIIIPSPFLAGGHQLKNAEQLQKAGAAVVLTEETTPDELLAVINELLNDDSRRWELAKNLYGTAKPDAAVRLADIILQTAEGRA